MEVAHRLRNCGDYAELTLSTGDVGRVDYSEFTTVKTAFFGSGKALSIQPSRSSWLRLNSHTGYAYNRIDRPGGQRFTVYLHRLLCECPVGMYVNHINFDTLDNRLCHLEIVSAAENARWRRSRLDWLATRGFSSAKGIPAYREIA